jgi:hypothetical protein
MGVQVTAGVGYGFTIEGGACEIQEEINKHGFKFVAVPIDSEGNVLVGVHIAEGWQNENGDELKHFDPTEEGVILALEELRSKMDAHSEIKFTFYFYYS